MEAGNELAEHIPTVNPEFETPVVSISAFATSPEGFDTFITNNNKGIRRSEGIADNRVFTPYQRERLKQGMLGEMRFNKVEEVKNARAALKNALTEAINDHTLELPEGQEDERGLVKNSDPDLYLARFMKAARDETFIEGLDGNIRSFYEEFESVRKKYLSKGKKLGIRNIVVNGNTVRGDVKFVSFPMYTEFSNPTDPAEILDFSSLAGTAMIIRTRDGRLLIQHRAVAKQRLTEDKLSSGNRTYPEVGGASSGGLIDTTTNSPDREKGTPDPIDMNSLKAAIGKETAEELGLDPSNKQDIEKIRMVAISHDKIKTHDVPVFFADSRRSAEEIQEISRNSNKNKNLGPADFEEKFLDFDASPEAIKTLLTKIQSPLPGDHVAAFVAAGYIMELEKGGKEAADRWKAEVEQGVQQNYAAINDRVKEFYVKHPEALTQVPERFWGKKAPSRRLNSYDPSYTPEEQGLPNFEDAMIEAGLLTETRKHVSSAWLFDVDGVLTNPAEKRVLEAELFDQIISRLQRGHPVGLNTGRSTAWIEERFITPLLERIEDKKILKNFVVIGEKGGTWITFDKEGNMHHGQKKELTIPEEVKEEARALIQERNDSMFFDETKETMLSVEMRDGFDLDLFHQRQREFVEELAQLLEERGLADRYRIDPTTIATDVESPYVGKALGADRFLQFLRDNNIKPAVIDTFGDSKSDFEMADELERRGILVKMVYVGDKSKLGELRKDYPVEYLQGYAQGALEYLKGTQLPGQAFERMVKRHQAERQHR